MMMNNSRQHRQCVAAHEAVLHPSQGDGGPSGPFSQPIEEGIDPVHVQAPAEHRAREPLIGPGNDRVMEPVVPEARVDHLRQEAGEVDIAVDEDRGVPLIHPVPCVRRR